MQLTAKTFDVVKFRWSMRRTTHRKFLEELIRAEDTLNMDTAMILYCKLYFP